jgi:colanic acid/amylovoran biosynthesis glycosyltransferase
MKSSLPRYSVAYVISRYTYQSTFIVREIEELAARGWQITVLSLRPPVFEPGSTAASLPFEVRYDRHLSLRFLVEVVREAFLAPGAVVSYMRLVARAYRRNPAALLRNLAIVPKALFYSGKARTASWKHLHAHWATVSTSAAMLMSELSGLRFSFTGHAWDIFQDTTLLAEKARAACFVLTCTEYNRRYLVDAARLPEHKIHVLYHGLRLQQPSDVVRELKGQLKILTVGRWSEKKGLSELVEALAVARDRGVDFSLTLIAGGGSSEYERRIRRAITDQGLDNRTAILPWLPHREVLEIMRTSDLFVLPCVRPASGAMDGIPNVLIEALSVGLPVIATRLSGIPELVRHGDTGLLVDERDVDGIADAIAWCATHRAEARNFAMQGRRLVQRAFDIDKTISMLEQRFTTTIAGRGGMTC